MESKILNTVELAQYINVKRSRIYELVYLKRIPYTKIGNLLRFRKDLIDKWLQNMTYIPIESKLWYNTTKQVKGEGRI